MRVLFTDRNFTSGAKAPTQVTASAARVKSRPFKAAGTAGQSRSFAWLRMTSFAVGMAGVALMAGCRQDIGRDPGSPDRGFPKS